MYIYMYTCIYRDRGRQRKTVERQSYYKYYFYVKSNSLLLSYQGIAINDLFIVHLDLNSDLLLRSWSSQG